MKKNMVLFIAAVLLCVPMLTGCGNSASDTGQSDTNQVQEDTSGVSDDSYDYVTENGRFTMDARTVLENIDKRMEGVSTYHILQDGPSVYVRWENQDVQTAVSCNKADGQTPIDSPDEIPGGLVVGTSQPIGKVSEEAINASVYVFQTLNANLASDSDLYSTVKEMASEADAMKEDVGEGGFSKKTIGDFDVTLLIQESDGKMLVMCIIKQK